jgi:acylphosphatase
MQAEKQAKRFFVSGRVQGVGYRYFATDAAEAIGVTGYAKNLADGRAIGTADQLRSFARELRRGRLLLPWMRSRKLRPNTSRLLAPDFL